MGPARSKPPFRRRPVARAPRCLAPARAAAVAVAATAVPAAAATLPPHGEIHVLVVSDRVNPHALPPAELTEPGDISAALLDPGSGLNLGPSTLVEAATNQIGSGDPARDPTLLLARPRGSAGAFDVLVYFAHRIPDDRAPAENQARQDAFVAAATAFVAAGGGVVSFHHGSYASAGKEAMLDLVGAAACCALEWNTDPAPDGGQRVIAAAPAHFVAANAVAYEGTRTYADPARGVPAGNYPFFVSSPDERYLVLDFDPTAEEVEVLFASDYVSALDPTMSDRHLLGWTHRRAGWSGIVVGFQPGEYQPVALDVGSPSFQVLANAVLWAGGTDLSGVNSLRAVRAPGRADVTLSWIGDRPRSAVYRSADPAAVVLPANEIGETAALAWTDAAPAGDALHYRVERP